MIWSHYSGQHDCYCCLEVVLYWELGCYCDVQSCVSHCAGVNVILTNMDSGMLEDENIFFINCLLWIQFSAVNHHHYQHDFIICVCCVLLMWSAVISKAGREGSAVGLSHIDRSLEPSSASSAPPSLSLHHKCNQNNHNHNQDMQLLHNQTDPSLISLPFPFPHISILSSSASQSYWNNTLLTCLPKNMRLHTLTKKRKNNLRF